MTEYTTQAVIWPRVPEDLLDEATQELLTTCGIEWEKTIDHKLYLFASDGPYNATPISDDGQETTEVDYVELLRQLIVCSAGRLTALTIEAADTCSKMRPDGFGGWAMIITADETHYLSTFEWVRDMADELGLLRDIYGASPEASAQGGGHVDDLG